VERIAILGVVDSRDRFSDFFLLAKRLSGGCDFAVIGRGNTKDIRFTVTKSICRWRWS
jgi:hypothetical protein